MPGMLSGSLFVSRWRNGVFIAQLFIEMTGGYDRMVRRLGDFCRFSYSLLVFSTAFCVAPTVHSATMRLSVLLENSRKSGAFRFENLRQSPYRLTSQRGRLLTRPRFLGRPAEQGMPGGIQAVKSVCRKLARSRGHEARWSIQDPDGDDVVSVTEMHKH